MGVLSPKTRSLRHIHVALGLRHPWLRTVLGESTPTARQTFQLTSTTHRVKTLHRGHTAKNRDPDALPLHLFSQRLGKRFSSASRSQIWSSASGLPRASRLSALVEPLIRRATASSTFLPLRV